MIKPKPSENDLVGSWIPKDNKMVGDDACDRIEQLVETYLVKVKSDWSGWNKLYQDPEDGRYWELTYPASHMHGGGPPRLTVITETEFDEKYKKPS